jgi:hypothetical protein
MLCAPPEEVKDELDARSCGAHEEIQLAWKDPKNETRSNKFNVRR